ncbi:MAG: SpoIIE family protein phosphatase [Mycobacterium sp.]|nr:SpoIIE family protein phosphatase [Mycobacterium sp.]
MRFRFAAFSCFRRLVGSCDPRSGPDAVTRISARRTPRCDGMRARFFLFGGAGLPVSRPSLGGSDPSIRRAAAVGAVVIALYALLVFMRWPNADFVENLTDFTFPVASLVYVPLAALTARSARGRLRAAWLALTVGFALWAVAEWLWTYYERVVGEVPYPSWADLFYMLYVPGVAVALLLFPSVGTWRYRSRLIVDGVIVTTSLFMISWLTVMGPIWIAGADNPLEFALSLAYPAGDVLLLAIGLMVLVRAPAKLRLTLGLLVAALAFSALGNGAWSYFSDPQAYRVGGLADVFYFANIVFFVLALIAGRRIQQVDDLGQDDSPGRLSLWLPLLPVAIAAVFVAIFSREATMEPPVVVAGLVLIVASLVRQLIQGDDLVGRERKNRMLADRLNEELDNAASYIASILPDDMRGPVSATSRYLPSRSVGGDSFGYAWVDDDHFIVYIIDVSGHGVKPALLSVSIHNLLRSGTLPQEMLLAPDRLFTELNKRFSMKKQDGHYFTMWYGVYLLSTGELRYANAGHPPPLILTGEGRGLVDTLSQGGGMPVGMLRDSEFTVESYAIAPGSKILLYSDGVMGESPRLADFEARCNALAATSADWLDSLVTTLPTDDAGHYGDDCSLVLLTFPRETDALSGSRV